jgi:Bifunctional DNA primase/polymerase, N-terminal
MTDVADAMLDYAENGWPVVPLHGIRQTPAGARCTCWKPDCRSPGKHPRTWNGLKDATTEVWMVREWLTRYAPPLNVGVLTGVVFDALDVDGIEGLASLLRFGGITPDQFRGPVVRTGRGFHLLVAPTGAGGHGGLLPGLDYRGVGGYVVAPPSVHENGTVYARLRWSEGHLPPPAPDWLRDLLFPQMELEV